MHWRFAKKSERNTCRLITVRGGTAIYRSSIPFVASVASINLRETGATDDDLASFAPLRHLDSAELGYNKLTDAGVETLLRHKNLAYLMLWGNPISDRSIEVLRDMSKLKMVSVLHTHVSTDAALELSRALPDCLVCHVEALAVFRGDIVEPPYNDWRKVD